MERVIRGERVVWVIREERVEGITTRQSSDGQILWGRGVEVSGPSVRDEHTNS